MSGLARLYLHGGAKVSGSDSTESEITRKLEEEGIDITYNQVAENISSRKDLELVVYTEAMAQDHPELVAAREADIRTVNYFEALGEIANEYYLIAVSGTHGKTTTTAMLIDIFEEASLDPSAIVGSLRTKTGSNYRAGKSKYFIVEACEYKRDFLTLEPDVLVITNIEHEHVDYYKNLGEVQQAFRELAEKVPEDGFIVTQTADPSVAPVLEGLKAKVIDYKSYLDLHINLTQPGLYNRMNAAAASAAAATQAVDPVTIRSALENFAGTWRRFQYKGDVNNAPVYDDYAHHPTEIRATIVAAREKFPDRQITVAFQSHTYSRTKELFDQFVTELSKADKVLLIPIYPAREEDKGEVSSEDLVKAIKKNGTEAKFFHTQDALALEIKETVGKEDVVIIMGAGEITDLAKKLI